MFLGGFLVFCLGFCVNLCPAVSCAALGSLLEYAGWHPVDWCYGLGAQRSGAGSEKELGGDTIIVSEFHLLNIPHF